MSRVGKLPVILPEGVEIVTDHLSLKVSGPKGNLSKTFKGDIRIYNDSNKVYVAPLNKTKQALAMWGTARSIINNMVKGVSIGFYEELEVNGVGYRAILKGDYLNLTLGKSHNTKIQVPQNIKVDTPKQNVILLHSNNKEELGQFIASIIKQRPPEPYKGKGIKFKGQYIRRKEGKKK